MTTNLQNDTRATDLDKLVRKLGTESAHSALAKPKMALAIAQARADGVITDDAGQQTYETYLAGRRAVLSKSHLGAGVEDSGSMKANVSKNTQIIKAAGLISAGVDFLDVMQRATTIREDLVKADEKVKPPFDCYVDLARAQLKEPTAALDDDAITDAVRKKESPEKDLIAKLCDDYKRVYKRHADVVKDDPNSTIAPMLVDGFNAIADAIAELGGEVPAMTKEEKEAAAAMAFLARSGFTVVKQVVEPIH